MNRDQENGKTTVETIQRNQKNGEITVKTKEENQENGRIMVETVEIDSSLLKSFKHLWSCLIFE